LRKNENQNNILPQKYLVTNKFAIKLTKYSIFHLQSKHLDIQFRANS